MRKDNTGILFGSSKPRKMIFAPPNGVCPFDIYDTKEPFDCKDCVEQACLRMEEGKVTRSKDGFPIYQVKCLKTPSECERYKETSLCNCWMPAIRCFSYGQYGACDYCCEPEPCCDLYKDPIITEKEKPQEDKSGEVASDMEFL